MGTARIITTDLSLPEGPVALDDGSWLVTELDFARGTIVRVTTEGVREPIAKTGRPNGLALAADGSVWVAESLEPALLRLQLSGEVTRELTAVEGRPLLWPNDLCFGPDGALYATDSGILVRDFLMADGKPVEGGWSMHAEGTVFRFDPRTGEASLIDEGLQYANGIAFGPDGLLYASETFTGNVYRYRIEDGRAVGERETFANVIDPDFAEPGGRGPDGMAFSADGRLWVAVFGQGDITVLDRDGEVERRIAVGDRWPTNVAFGLDGDTRIYIVGDERGSLVSIDAGATGLPLYS